MFFTDPKGTINRLQKFCELESVTDLEHYCASPLPQFRYAQTAPAQGKWTLHKVALVVVFPSLIPIINKSNTFTADA